jgi:drug/metabolite transporter (DMT)-like permease
MSELPANIAEAGAGTQSYRIRVILAFFAIYVLWGTTFLAIRIAVEEMPPLFAAGVRFFTAGVALFGFLVFVKGETRPTRLQWRNLALMGLLMFVAEYAPLFWAEKFVPSGVVSVLAATIPILTMISEVVLLRLGRIRPMMVAATLLGFVGVAALVWPGARQHFGVIPCLAVLAGSTGWASGSVLSRSLELPKARPVTAGAIMMLGGGGLLLLSAAFGEMHSVPHISARGGFALLYLIVIGSLVAFTAYIWLLAHMPASRVSSYAYVNPIVAVALGYFAAGEVITPRMLAGTLLVVTSVFLTLRRDK